LPDATGRLAPAVPHALSRGETEKDETVGCVAEVNTVR
jgi:hypothetical protein